MHKEAFEGFALKRPECRCFSGPGEGQLDRFQALRGLQVDLLIARELLRE